MPKDSGVTSSRTTSLTSPCKNTGLNGGTHRNNFVRVHTLVWLFAEELCHFFNNARHAGHTTNQDDFVDVGRGQTRVLKRGWQGFIEALIRSPTRLSSFARVSFMTMCKWLASLDPWR